jgi:adenylate cyclase
MNKPLIAGVMAVVVWLLGLFLVATPPLRSLELNLMDMLFELRGPKDISDSPVVLVAISEQSAFELDEKWPWPTHLYARLIHNLNRAGVKAIGLDVIFDKTDIYDPRNDSLFADAMATYGNVVLAGNVLADVQRSFDQVGTVRVESRQLVQPNRLFQEANPNPWGYVEVERDRDGFLRRYGLPKRHMDMEVMPFGVELVRVAYGIPRDRIKDDGDVFQVGDWRIPKFNLRSFKIHYAGPRSSFPEFNFSDVVDDQGFNTASEDEEFQINAFDDPDFGLLSRDVFRDKIVIVGATMPELQDFFATPFAPIGNMPGYETHANAIQTILDGTTYQRLNNNWLLLLSLISTSVLIAIAMLVSALWALVAFIIFMIVVGYAAYIGFVNHLLVIEATPFLVPGVIGYIGAVSVTFFIEQREKSRIRNMFGAYVSPELVTKMVESREEPKLGGEMSHITAFFSDIQNFSTFSEQLPPDRLVNLMNEYLTAMTDIVMEEGGTLDKYIGDAIVAFWGAPMPIEDHAYRACVASQRMMRRQKELQAKWRQEGDWPDIVYGMQTRMGMNSGPVITGNMGSARRFNYTMMGDNVNLAARCESGAKSYGIYTMVSEETRKQAERFGNDLLFRTLDKIVVKGRSQPVVVCEVLGLKADLPPTTLDLVSLYERGLEAYWSQDWDTAIGYFKQSAANEGNEYNPSIILLGQSNAMKLKPPGPDWDGVYMMTSK